ncbi:MAG: bacteriohemerythrin [Sterolibacterium sp.]
MPVLKSTPVIEWNDQLATGLVVVDAQHRRLIDIINELGRLRGRTASVEELLEVIGELRNYTIYHFQTEADLMEGYPVDEANKNSHLNAHQGFAERLDSAAGMVATNPADVVDHLLAFLVKWLVHHITGVDARMAREISALHAGTSPIAAEKNTLHDALIDTVSDLYDSIGVRTFEMLELNRRLQAYQELQEEENALAQDIIMRLMQRGGLSDSKLQHWIVPAATFSGDIVAATRSPRGLLYAILADATGHGLAAAITVLPVMTTFYSMAERDRPIAEMVVELNRNLHMTLPVDRFVSAALLCVDEKQHTAEIWNGGMPEVLLLSPDGDLLQTIVSSQMPLGIADFEKDMAATRIQFAEGNQFVMYSDGLIEAVNPAGDPFGFAHLVAVLKAVPANQRLTEVQHTLLRHLDSASSYDDISLLLVD